MAFQKKIERKSIRTAYIRKYPDTGQRIAYVEWGDGSWTSGDPNNVHVHMKSLLDRARREGLRVLRYD